VTVLPMDVTDPYSIQRAKADLAGEAIDVLVNSAGVFGKKRLISLLCRRRRHWFRSAIGAATVVWVSSRSGVGAAASHRMRESRSSGSVGGEGGNLLAYPASSSLRALAVLTNAI
jgi:NAD(P)-dependent dehydrogenase (short-subunit alcohol dehydrogenase family)